MVDLSAAVREEYPFEPHYCDQRGVRMHYLDEGEGEPIVMVHGNPTWSFYFRRLVQALSDRYRVIVPDHVGCGLSEKPDDQQYHYTLARRVEDLGRLIDSLGLEQVTLVVHDWGGMIGTAWAVQNPDRVKAMFISNTAAFFSPPGFGLPSALRLARTPGLGAVLVRGFNVFSKGANRFCVTRRPLAEAAAAGYLAPYASFSDRIAVHRFVQDIPLSPGDDAYAVVDQTQAGLEKLKDVPKLFCWGMRDFVFNRKFLDEWERRCPEGEFHRFADAGHYLLEDAFEDVLPLVEAFLERVGETWKAPT